MYAPVDYIHDTVIISMILCCEYASWLTTNGFNCDKSQPDHTSQNMSLC